MRTNRCSLRRGRPRRPLAACALALLPAVVQANDAQEERRTCAEGRAIIAAGVCLTAEATLDALGVTSGGVRRGIAATGRLSLGLDADLEALVGLEGWSLRLTAYGIHGRQPTPTLVGSLAAMSNVEALSTVRLSEVWAQRSIEGLGSLRVGRLAADAEFAVADAGANLVNGTFGWPLGLTAALPFGGPAYPVTALGIRIEIGAPDEGTGLRVGLFNGRPVGVHATDTDPQRADRYGLGFTLGGGVFTMAEGVTGVAAPDGAGAGAPRPWVLKLGAWHHSAAFDSLRDDAQGLPLADPASTGMPRRLNDNWGGYAIGEVTLWRGGSSSLAAFGRAFWAPPDRNLVTWQLDGGLSWRGPFERAADRFSLGVSAARIGSGARDHDAGLIRAGADRPRRDHETVAEVNYDFGIVPGQLSLRPLAQWVIHPGAREPDERVSTTARLRNAVLVGLRIVATL